MTAHTFQLATDAESFTRLRAITKDFCARANVRSEVTCRLLVVLEELFTNTVKHGYRRGEGVIRISIEQIPGYISIIYEDAAPPFDPINAASADPETTVNRKKVGGMGLPLIRKMADSSAYERNGPWNRTAIMLGNPE